MRKIAVKLMGGVCLAVMNAGCTTTAPQIVPAEPLSLARAMCGLGYKSIQMNALRSGHHIVDVVLNGTPATFVVDSGAGGTVLHKDYVDYFGLKPVENAQPTQAIGAGGPTPSQQMLIESFAVSGEQLNMKRISAMDLSHVVKALEVVAGQPVHGVIGQNVLRPHRAVLDVHNSLLYILPAATDVSKPAPPTC